jgi:Flp pilus assembly protein TadG
MSSSDVPAPAKSLLRRFRRNRRGSAAVEFALVAPVFLALLFAIIEVALMFYATQVLETITQDAARYVLTGQAQNGTLTQSQFKTYVCSRIPALFTCSGIYVDVESQPSFSNVNLTPPVDGNGHFTPSTNYCPGNAGQVVMVRLQYVWPLFVTGLGFNMSNYGSNQRVLWATAVFQNEPYTATASASC